MKRYLELKRTRHPHQLRFPFYERSRRRQLWFKLGLIALTGLAIGAILAALPKGRDLVAAVPVVARYFARSAVGQPTPRAEIDALWRRRRLQGVEDSKTALAGFYAKADPAHQRLLRYGGLDPDHALHRRATISSRSSFPQPCSRPMTQADPSVSGRAPNRSGSAN
jgi:hypothetical protein